LTNKFVSAIPLVVQAVSLLALRRSRYLPIVFCVFLLGAFAVSIANGQNLSLQTVIGGGLSQPLFLTAPPGDHNRLFILEKGGQVRVFDRQTNALLAAPYLSIPVSAESERGLLGLAFDPGFATNGRFYVNYTTPGIGPDRGDIIVARYTVSGDPMTSNIANASAETLLRIEHSSDNAHNAGWIGFRPTDPGRLYIAVGDGHGSNDLPNNAQNTNLLLGKMLRIDVSGAAGYTIPPGNRPGGLPEIYQMGLRNPWRNSFDRLTGDFWIGDVGQSQREEINFQAAGSPGGQNFGWRSMEGNFVTGLNGPGPFPGLTGPIHEYVHNMGASITGGYVYRGEITGLQGQYFFADFSHGRIWTLQYNGSRVTNLVERTNQIEPLPFQIASFGEDAAGELYILALQRGAVYRIVPEPSSVALLISGMAGLALLARRGMRLRRPG
jgi:glucose/arabinose dehydrogenase